METSPKFSFKNTNRKKIGIGALVAVSGALLTYASQTISGMDFGQWTPIIMTGFSILANIVRKWIISEGGTLPTMK